MKILVVGSGGREHALVYKLSQGKDVEKIYAAPGNVGMSDLAECVNIAVDNISGMVEFAKEKGIDLTVIGPELPLTLGMVDAFEEAGLRAFGPNKAAAQLEGSKAFSKTLMKKYRIPTARFAVFNDAAEARQYVRTFGAPCVIKADGLAAGKGVIICNDVAEAEAAVTSMLVKSQFGSAGDQIVIEELMTGPEVSVLAFCDGEHVLPMVSAQDHKRIFDNDQGPNTGGMGAYSPAPMYSDALAETCYQEIFLPTIRAMKEEGCLFKGILYTGLMLTPDGPRVLEYNVRFGDPETQPVLMRLQSDLAEVMQASIDGRLDEVTLQWDDGAAVCVVMAAGGYPGVPEKGRVIDGLDHAFADGVKVFHSGTKAMGDDIVTNGGRVLGVTAVGDDIRAAIDKAYEAVEVISFDNMQYRKDIGAQALK